MTNKTIIINKINVRECQYLNPLYNGVYECILGKKQILKHRVCDCNHNCYFKQAAKEKKEKAKIKSRVTLLRRKNEALNQKNINFKKKLKNQEELLSDFISDNSSLYLYDDRRPSDLDELQECMTVSMANFLKLKQTLNEIEKIADENLCENNCDICPDDCMCDWREIKNIIHKAKDGR